MQSLLCQILRECPELIPFASTRRWQADENSIAHKDAWTRKELTASLANIMARGQLTSRFCFFIDGLDEHADENAGEHHELIGYLDLLAQSPQVKLCVSSRPWTVFKDRYAERKDLTLVLEELTLGDMHRYVDGILNNDERFRQLVGREPQALALGFQIRGRAEGVFLWVYLVLRSLLKGLSEHDDTMELERRLSMIPSDLNAFFLKIFQNLDPTYEREAMHAFHMSTVAPRLPLMVFRYLAKEVQNPRYAFEMTAAELKVLNQQARDDVSKWCRDLLEVKDYIYHCPGADDEVGFLHRTVRDFLLTREMQAYFASHAVCQSSARQASCMCYLAEIKNDLRAPDHELSLRWPCRRPHAVGEEMRDDREPNPHRYPGRIRPHEGYGRRGLGGTVEGAQKRAASCHRRRPSFVREPVFRPRPKSQRRPSLVFLVLETAVVGDGFRRKYQGAHCHVRVPAGEMC